MNILKNITLNLPLIIILIFPITTLASQEITPELALEKAVRLESQLHLIVIGYEIELETGKKYEVFINENNKIDFKKSEEKNPHLGDYSIRGVMK